MNRSGMEYWVVRIAQVPSGEWLTVEGRHTSCKAAMRDAAARRQVFVWHHYRVVRATAMCPDYPALELEAVPASSAT